MADQRTVGSGASATPAASGAVRGASLMIMLQVVSRAVTFVANQLLLRFLTAQLLGISTQLEVYYLSVLFFARESLRVAIQRQGSSSSSSSEPSKEKKDRQDGDDDAAASKAAQARDTQAVVNLAYLSIALGLVVALVLGQLYLSSVSADTLAAAPHLATSLRIYAAAAVVELLSEPAFMVLQTRLAFGARAAAESVATFARCAVTLVTALLSSRLAGGDAGAGVLPFALGQLSYGVALLGVYLWHGSSLSQREGFSLLPKRVVDGHSSSSGGGGGGAKETLYIWGYLYRPTLSLARSMIAQSVVKHVLTQGDTFLVTALSSPTAQGVYALANNYGGLAARLVFQPVEESSRSYFSRLLLSSPASVETDQSDLDDSSKNKDGKHTSSSRKGKKNKPTDGGAGGSEGNNKPQVPKEAAQKAAGDLTVLLKLYALLSLVVLALGPHAAPLLVSLVAGPRWASSGAGGVLAVYALYIPLLAINGVAEAFVASVASEAEVHLQSIWMGAFSVVFAAVGFVSLRVLDMGAGGLVLANGVNMTCRIVWCAWFVKRYFRRQGVSFEVGAVRPGALAVAAAAVTGQLAGSVVARSATAGTVVLRGVLVDLVKLAGVAVVFIAVVVVSERQFLQQCFESMRGRKPAAS